MGRSAVKLSTVRGVQCATQGKVVWADFRPLRAQIARRRRTAPPSLGVPSPPGTREAPKTR